MDRRSFLALGSAATLGATISLARSAIPAATFPAEVQAIMVSGFEEPGDRGYGAVYVRGDAGGLLAIQANDGSWWNLKPGPVLWAGWFGALANGQDDTEAIQRAIDHAAGRDCPTTVNFASGIYRVAKVLGRVEILARDDGTHPTAPAIEPEPTYFQARCLSLREGVSLRGEGEVRFIGNYKYGTADNDQAICIVHSGDRELRDSHVENIDFVAYFIGICAMGDSIPCNLRYFDIHFKDCAIGIYSRIFERCYFDRITARGTGCVIVVGGQWTTRRDTWRESGGYADKCYFGVIDNIYNGRLLGQAEENIDKYFDEYFFKTRNNAARGGPVEASLSLMRRYPYRGICGRCIYIMARYGRPSNADVFILITHAAAPRPAVWIDSPVACSGDVLALELCGLTNVKGSEGEIGMNITDPYLGDGVKVPAFVKGYSPVIISYQVSAERLTMEMADTRHYIYASNLGPSRKER